MHVYIDEDIDMSIVNSVLIDTLVLDFPNKIIERLQDISGVSKVEIYNSNNELLINSEKMKLINSAYNKLMETIK